MRNYKTGSAGVSLLIFMLVIMAFATVVGEYMRIHTIQTKVEQQLIQASNIAIETAMHDSYRQDHEGYIDYQVAYDAFYSYLYYEMGLDSSLRLYGNDGELLYQLECGNLGLMETPPAVTFECTLRAHSIFSFFTDDIVVPFNIRSKNARAHD